MAYVWHLNPIQEHCKVKQTCHEEWKHTHQREKCDIKNCNMHITACRIEEDYCIYINCHERAQIFTIWTVSACLCESLCKSLLLFASLQIKLQGLHSLDSFLSASYKCEQDQGIPIPFLVGHRGSTPNEHCPHGKQASVYWIKDTTSCEIKKHAKDLIFWINITWNLPQSICSSAWLESH